MNRIWLVAGLGNPGAKYALTRHNIGFMALDVLNESLDRARWSDQHKAQVVKTKIKDDVVILAKPQTFMNLSGQSVVALMNFYKIPQENLITVHDEIDQPFKAIKIQKNRGHGGHNGIRNISELLGSPDYQRLRLGVGRPENPNIPVADYVLNNFLAEEQTQLVEFLNKAGDAIESMIVDGYQKASSLYNG